MDEKKTTETTPAQATGPIATGDRKPEAADAAMREIWKQWLEFYTKHFRGPAITISMADQQAFYEIAQPILRGLTKEEATDKAAVTQEVS